MFASGFQADLGHFQSKKVIATIKMDKPYNLEDVLATINMLLKMS